MAGILSHSTPLPDVLKLLAHDLRWDILRVLSYSDRRVQELVEHTGQPINLISYHLKKLRDEALVEVRRSEADGRDVYYTLDLDRLRDLYAEAGAMLHPALTAAMQWERRRFELPPNARVLILCTHNSARSQMAEGWLRTLSDGRVEVASAGSHPTTVHPQAIRAMDAYGVDLRGQQSRHWRIYEGQTFDYVITVCDKARETCPTFPGAARYLHWGYADPVQLADDTARAAAFDHIAGALRSRAGYFLQTLVQEVE